MNNAQLEKAALNEYNGVIERGLRLADLTESAGGFAEYCTKGKLSIEEDNRRAFTAIMLENTKNWLLQMDEATRAMQVGGFTDFLFPLVRASFTTNPIFDFVSIQPMTRKTGLAFFLNYVIGQTKGDIVKGAKVFDTFEGYNGSGDYSSEGVENESMGASANPASATVSGVMAYLPVRPATVEINIADTVALVIRDNGNGQFTKVSGTPTISSSSINYVTGAWSVTFSATLGVDKSVYATYQYDSETSGNLPQIDIQLSSASMEAVRRAMRLRYSSDAAFDFRQEFGMDVDPILVAGLAELIQTDQAREVIHDLWKSTGAPVEEFSLTVPAGISRRDHFSDFVYNLERASNSIYSDTQRAHANFGVCDVNGASFLRSINGFEAAPVNNATQGIQYIGSISGIRFWVDKLLGREPGASTYGNIMLGYRGSQFFDSGYIWAPYQPLTTTPPVVLDDHISRRGMAMRYAKMMINPRMYKRIALKA